MSIYYSYFFTRLTLDSAHFIRFLRINRKLSFALVYKLATHAYSELNLNDTAISNHKMAIGHTLSSATMYFLDEVDRFDEWFFV